MELLQLRYFQKVAQLENVTQAAKYFSVPQPSMSQAMARLERELNTQLFERRSGRLFLNEKGRLFLGHVERMLKELDSGIAAVNADPGVISGPVSIKVMENHRFVLTCIPEFSKQWSDVQIAVSHGYHEDPDLPCDLCICSHPTYKRMTAAVPLIRESVVLAVHQDHPLAGQKSIPIEALRGQRLISLPPQTALHGLTLKHCRAAGFEPNIPIVCDDPYFIRKYVSENMGVALAPAISWKGRFRDNTVLVPITAPEIRLTSYLLWDDSRYLSPAAVCFRDFLLEQAKAFSRI